MREFALRLSSAAIWGMRCHAYPMMNKGRREIHTDNQVREEGNATHWAAFQMATGYVVTANMLAPNGISITDEMLDAIELYFRVIRSWGCHPSFEQQLAAPLIHDECGGTPDVWAYNPALIRPRIHVADLKMGYRLVDVFENYQLAGYTSAIISHLGIDGHAEQFIDVEFTIIQPRAYSKQGAVRTWTVPLVDLRGMWNQLANGAQEAMKPNPVARVSSHCNDCDARYDCDTLHKATLNALDVAGQASVLDLPPIALDDELTRISYAMDILHARKTGLEAQAEHMIRNGNILPHWELLPGPGRTVWIDGKQSEMEAIASLLGQDIRKPGKLLTPLQAASKLPEDILSKFTQRQSGAVKLVPYSADKARKIFQS